MTIGPRSYLQMVALLALAAGCGVDGALDEIGVGAKAIVNGQTETGHPAVGVLRVGSLLCTASLVGQRTVLTAAHCVVGGSASFELAGQVFSVTEMIKHPQYSETQVGTDGGYLIKNDIAIAKLAKTPPVQPVNLATTRPNVGSMVTIVGFGVTSLAAHDAGTKRSATHVIDWISTTELRYKGSFGTSGNICEGDSGGPSFAWVNGYDAQVGVHSRFPFSTVKACGEQGIDTRVDAYLPWLQQVSSGDIYLAGQATPGDVVPPQVQIITPLDGADPSGATLVQVNATDNSGVTRVDLLINGALVDSRATAPYDFQLFTPPPPGSSITAAAYDQAGNSGLGTVQLGGEGDVNGILTVRFLSPGNNAAVPANTSVPVTLVTTGRPRQVALSIDGVIIDAAVDPPYAFEVVLPVGTTTLQAEAVDAEGGYATSSIFVHPAEGIVSNPGDPLNVGGPQEHAFGFTGCSISGASTDQAPGALLLVLALLGLCVLGRRRA